MYVSFVIKTNMYIYILSKQPNKSYFILSEKNKVLWCYHNEHQPDGEFQHYRFNHRLCYGIL